jgi:hypothetical protein
MRISEVDFEQLIVDAAHQFGWKVAGFRPARTETGWRTPVKYDATGWPDLTLVHPGNGILVFAELKSADGHTSPHQDLWADHLESVEQSNNSIHYFEWRPSATDAILAFLRHPADHHS